MSTSKGKQAAAAGMSGALRRSGTSAKPDQGSRTSRSSGGSPRVDYVKLTIELEPATHRKLKTFALLKADDASLADVVRACITAVDKDETVAAAVTEEVERLKAQRKS